jgi:hypothetical protein
MQIKIILSLMALFSIVFFVPSDAFAAWYDTEWEYRNKITVSLNSVISNDLSDFPVLIKFTHNDLKQANESEGRDFVFTLSDGTTKLFHEIESYDNTTGEIIAWVNFPTLAAASSTDIYIYYKGNTIGYNSADVWNDDYVLVWHLNQTSTGTAGEFSDATGNGNDGRGGGGTKVGYSAGRIPHDTDGQIGAGQELKGPTTTGSGEGTGDMIWTNDNIQGMPTRDFSIELWVGDIVNGPDNANNYLYNDLVSFCTTHTNDANNKWSNHLNLWRSGNVKMKAVNDFYVSTTDPGHPVDNNNPASFTNWNHIVAVYNLKDADGTQGSSQLYINGELVKDENRSGNLNRVIQTSDLRMVLGGDVDGRSGNNCAKVNNELIGKVDELRISSGLRTADYAAATYFNQGNPSTYLSLGGQEGQVSLETLIISDCHDCEAPKLTKVQVSISSNTDSNTFDNSLPHVSETRDFAWHFDTHTPLPMFGDSITPIVADPGDDIEIILEITDNRSVKKISDAGTYTNFIRQPSDMNLFFANNFDKYGKVSSTFYEWRQTGDDLVYDYSNTVQWSKPNITIKESGVFVKDKPVENFDDVIGIFTISFKMMFNEPMKPSPVLVQATDLNGNFFKVALPLTLEISGPESLVFDAPLRQKVVSFFDEGMLAELVSNWNGSSSDVAELESLIGIPHESVPKWVVNLATWVSEDKITAGDVIIAIEHLINN